MMESMWKIKLDDYEQAAIPPGQILEQQCEHLKTQTEGRVLARISRYKGALHEKFSIHDLMDEMGGVISPATFKIKRQKKLGDIGDAPDMYFTYEFYLTSPSTPKYKFRVMFVSYVAGQYPVDIVLDDDIATDILRNDDTISCSSENEFKAILLRIFNSKRVAQVIRALNKIATEDGNSISSDSKAN